jgi:transcriptional regulator with XRE-family HTH domain
MEKDYQFSHDLLMAEQTLHFTKTELAAYLHVDRLSLAKWENGETYPRPVSLESFYAFLYEKGVRLNEIKAELVQEENPTEKILFHGSRTGIEGPLSVEKSLPNKDFGKGFYCGESLSQSISFVASVPSSSVYLYAFDPSGLSHADFAVEQEWMLAIALFRGRLAPYQNHPLLRSIEAKVAASDYVIAPIADNRMFEIITQFIDGEITDVQCQHCLSATDLGKQYVLLSPKALTRLRPLEHCYLSTPERAESLKRREEIAALGADKVKIARIRYRGQGHYLEEILS